MSHSNIGKTRKEKKRKEKSWRSVKQVLYFKYMSLSNCSYILLYLYMWLKYCIFGVYWYMSLIASNIPTWEKEESKIEVDLAEYFQIEEWHVDTNGILSYAC